jgi:hypothetical protein
VVLPASGWDMIAKVLLRCISSSCVIVPSIIQNGCACSGMV